MKSSSWSTIFQIISAMLLIAGTCIGGGMLALPVSGGRSGFFPSITIMLFAWVFMTITGLLYLEVSLWLKDDAHIISMASKLLGKWVKYLCWIIYLFIGYASLVAYLSEGGKMTGTVLSSLFNQEIGKTIGCFIYIFAFALILLMGGKVLGRLNSLLFFCMIAVYGLLVWFSASELQIPLLYQQRWQSAEMISLFPLMLTTFSYPGLVPIIVSALKKNIKHVRIAIVGGTTVTFITYLLWLAVVLGTVPYDGQYGLQSAYAGDNSAAVCLVNIVNNPIIASLAQFFGFFALTTSFLGISWALYHFLSDGLKIPALGWGKVWLGGLIIVPSLLLTLNFEKVFFAALEISGGIGDALISGMIPAAMVWAGRYKKGYKSSYRTFGGKILLAFIMVLGLLILSYEIAHRFL